MNTQLVSNRLPAMDNMPKRVPEVSNQLDCADGALKALSNAVMQLCGKLDPVSGPRVPQPTPPKQDLVALTPLAERIRSLMLIASELRETVEDQVNRLEI